MKNRTITLSSALFCFVLSTGCKVFLPAHPNSQATSEERVSVNLISFADATNNACYTKIAWQSQDPKKKGGTNSFVELYKGAFNKPLKPVQLPHRTNEAARPFPPAAAALGAAVIGYAVDYVKKQLDQEATQYQAQFDSNVSDDSFWKAEGTHYLQNYCGFEIIRSVRDTTNAFRLICGISPSADGQFFRIAPLFQQTMKSKAKVLSNRFPWLSYPASWFSALRNPSYEVDTTVDIECDGYWMDKDNNSKFGKLATFPLKFNKVNLDTQAPFLSIDNKMATQSKTSGWLVSVPPSQNTVEKGMDGSPALGVFTLTARVTEVDASNTKQLLEQAAKAVGDNETKIIAYVTNAIPQH